MSNKSFMFYALKRGQMVRFFKKALHKIGSKFGLFDEPDIYVFSYPKSGRTWLRALIGKYLSLKYNLPENRILSTEFMTSKSGLPSVSFKHGVIGMQYNKLSRDKQKYTNKKVILLGRDIKDTLVSAYFQATKRRNFFEGTISEFIATEQFGVLKIVTFYDIWLQNRHVPKSFLFIRYEDLHQDPRGILRKVLSFIGEVGVEENLLHHSIEYCSFTNLKKLEAENKFKNKKLKPKNAADPESFKVRKGKIGGYTEYLSEEDVEFIDKAIKKHRIDFAKFYEI